MNGFIRSTNFDTDNALKAKTQQAIREHFFESLIKRDYDPTKTLLILHRLATFNTGLSEKDGHPQPDKLLLARSRHALLWDELRDKEIVVGETPNLGELKVTYPSPSAKGRFRLLAQIESEWGKEDVYHPVGINMYSRALGEGDYAAPTLSLTELTNELGTRYRNLVDSLGEIDSEYKLVMFLMYLIFFHTVGCKFIHPFMGGNHRTFDRFMELEFKRMGLKCSLPQDETSNIPVDDPIRKPTGRLLLHFILKCGIDFDFFPRSTAHYFRYAEGLNMNIKAFIDRSFEDDNYLASYLESAKTMLSWLDLVGTNLYKQKAIKMLDKSLEEVLDRIKSREW